jgi:DNA-binding transcriptional ArsR family regulator
VAGPAAALNALGNEIRWTILEMMSRVDELPFRSIEDSVALARPSLSYHLKVLTEAGLIVRRKAGRELFYSLHEGAVHALADVIVLLAHGPAVHLSSKNPSGRTAVAKNRPAKDLPRLTR